MKSLEIQNLDQHLKPLKIDGVTTPIEISNNDVRIDTNVEMTEDLVIGNDIYLTGRGQTIYLTQGMNIQSDANSSAVDIECVTLNVNGFMYGQTLGADDKEAIFGLTASADQDTSIVFRHGLTGAWRIGNDATDGVFKFESGAATLGTAPDLQISSAGLVTAGGDIVAGDDIAVAATGKFSFDGIGGHTYIHEDADDSITFIVGGDTLFNLTEGAGSKDKADFGTTSVGFNQGIALYNASDTEVYFNRMGNKIIFTFGSGNVTDMNIRFPDMSGNFVLLVKQDGTGSRTVTNWKTLDQDGGNESTVKWAGGSAPTLTTTADKTDILSFYWDNTNHTGYGVATLNF